MSMQMSYVKQISVGGKSFSGTNVLSGETALVSEESIPAAKSGSLTTRTDNDTGTATMSSGHGITTGAVVDVYWSGGSRRGMTVGTVATNSVPLDGGSGDNLPAQDTAVTVMVPVQFDMSFVGDEVQGFALWGEAISTFSIQDGSGEIIAYVTSAAAQVISWSNLEGTDNPLASESPTKVLVSHGETAAKVIRVGILVDD